MGGVLSSETTWFQDWSCQRQDGICARTDTIDAITITEIGGDPAEAGPISGYPAEALPLSATPRMLEDVRPLDGDYIGPEIERGRPILEPGFGDEQVIAAPAMLSEATPDPFRIDAAFGSQPSDITGDGDAPFEIAFPQAVIGAQLSALGEKMNLGVLPRVAEGGPPEPASEVKRNTRTLVSRDGVEIPEDERVSELTSFETKVSASSGAAPMTAPPEESADTAQPNIVPIVTLETVPSVAPDAVADAPRRSAAKVLPVVISPYVDARGIYHERSVIWVEVEPADWILE